MTRYGVQYQPLSGTISIGRINRSQDRFLDKEDHTQACVRAVRELAPTVADPIELWELHEKFNEQGTATSIPVVAANGIFWMSYPYEDGDCLYVGMECGDPRERLEWHGGDTFYPRIESNDDLIRYPLRVLWTPDEIEERV